MKGSVWAASLPPNGDQGTRESAIFKAVQDGNYVLNFVPIYVTSGSVSAVFMVSSDVLKIGEPGDAIRVNCSHRLSQQIADQLGCILPTAKLSDEIWRQADLKLEPPTQCWFSSKACACTPCDGSMGQNRRMIDFDRIVTSKIASRPYVLVAGHHKDWISSSLLGTPTNLTIGEDHKSPAGCNYGFHNTHAAITNPAMGVNKPSQTIPGVQTYQPAGVMHAYTHADYSQLLGLIKRLAFVCGPAAISGFGQEATPIGLSCPLPSGGLGVSSFVDVYSLIANGGDYTKVLSGEGQILLRHPAMGDPPPLRQSDSCHSLVPGACDWPPPDGQQVAPVADGMSQAKALAWLTAGAIGGYLLVRSVPTLVKKLA